MSLKIRGTRAIADVVKAPLSHRSVANIYGGLDDQPKISPQQPAVVQPSASGAIIENLPIDVAADKLRRQNEHILQGDAVNDELVKRNRNSRANKWKPFDFREVETDLPDAIGETRHTPLDAHAKPFTPTPPLHHSVEQDFYGDGWHRYGLYETTQSHREDDAPSRTPKSSGLGAYHVAEDSQTPTVAGHYSEQEIHDVFGTDLPSPSYCRSHPGHDNGEIQFCIHPNGDVSAQQWFASHYQWTNVGQYSNIRKRVEGQLASDRLRGELEGHTLQQNTLAYFFAIAKQREAMVMGRAFGLEQIRACLPDEPPNDEAGPPMPSTTTDGSVSTFTAPPTDISHGVPLANSQHIRNPVNESRYNNLTFGSVSYQMASTSDQQRTPGLGAAALAMPNHNLPMTYGHRRSMFSSPPGLAHNGHSHGSSMSTPYKEVESRQHASQARTNVREFLASMNDSSPGPSDTPGRTVMHDPISQASSDAPTAHEGLYGPRLTFRGMLEPPEKARTDHIPHVPTAEHHQPPTPQVLESGVLWHPKKQFYIDPEADAQLENWWFSTNKAARQHDFTQRLIAEHEGRTNDRPARGGNPGVIGPPSKAQLDARAQRPSVPSHDRARMLVALHENLQSYVVGSEDQRYGPFARFTQAPEWAVDKSATGNNSFFDEDWGKPPERIGRDQRYSKMGRKGSDEAWKGRR